MANKKKVNQYKLILLGESGVGKTALVQRFVNDFFTA
jgi:GTPase SAR1 family protein